MLASTMIESLALEFGENPQDGDVVAALLGFIKDVVDELNLSGEWKHTRKTYTFDTTTSQNVESLPTEVGEIYAIQRTDTGRPLSYVPTEILTDASLILSTEGEPAYWEYDVIDDDVTKLRLYPTPDAEYGYTVYYETSGDDILTESSTLSLPRAFYPVLKHGVRVHYFAQAGEEANAQRFSQKFYLGVDQLRSRYERTRRNDLGPQYNDIEEGAQWPTPQLPTTYARIG
jgi:hypothetical protein